MTFPAPYRARPARRDDLDALVALFEARDRVDVGFVDPSRDEIVADWAVARFDFERDTVVAEAPDGAVAAYGLVLALDPAVQVFAMGKVHPEHTGRGLGSALLVETERRAALRLPPGVSAPFRYGHALDRRRRPRALRRRAATGTSDPSGTCNAGCRADTRRRRSRRHHDAARRVRG